MASLVRLIPVQIRFDKAARASPDDTSRSFRAAAHVPGTDTPQLPATPHAPYRAPRRNRESRAVAWPEPEFHHPLDDSPEGWLTPQFDAERGRVLAQADLAVLELRTQQMAGSAFEGYLVHL